MFFYDLDKIIKKKIISYSKDIPLSEIRILVAYSGGVDSSVLLYIIDKLSKELNFKYDFVMRTRPDLFYNSRYYFSGYYDWKNDKRRFYYHRGC